MILIASAERHPADCKARYQGVVDVVVCNTINARWLLVETQNLASLCHPQTLSAPLHMFSTKTALAVVLLVLDLLEGVTHQIRCYKIPVILHNP